MITSGHEHALVWMIATVIYASIQLVMESLGLTELMMGMGYSLIVGALVMLPLLFRPSWHIALWVAAVVWLLSSQLSLLTGGFYSGGWLTKEIALLIAEGSIFWLSIIVIRFCRQYRFFQSWWLVLAGFIPAIILIAFRVVDVSGGYRMALSIFPPLSIFLLSIVYVMKILRHN